MAKPKPQRRQLGKQRRQQEAEEIEFLQKWLEFGKPDSGSNPLSLPPLPRDSPVGKLNDDTFSRYCGCELFKQMPLSKKTKDGLRASNFTQMTDVQRASLPHSLSGRDLLGAAQTGSGKTLAFVIPVIEKLYKERWGPEDGVGCIIISPTRELASQIFGVLKAVGKHHGFSAGLLIGGRKGVDEEKERVNELNILICTPGRLLQHMDETPNFECSQLQILVLDEADRILDIGFKKEVNAIVSQLPKKRQTLLFSATQTKSVQDLARLSLRDPEYLNVHAEATTATPKHLLQTATVVPLHQKLDLLWSFIKSHLNSRILVFLTSCKQVKFVFEAFKKLRPGIPLKCLHGKMNQERRLGTYSQFSEKRIVLFSTDVSSRGLDFDKSVDWVVQMDCPSDVATYIHRVGRTARYTTGGKAVLFVEPSEVKMLEKLKEAKIPIIAKTINKEKLQPVSPLLASLLVKYPDMQQLARRAFITYLKAVCKEKDKEVFDVMKLGIDDFSASIGLPLTPKIRFLNQKITGKNSSKLSQTVEIDKSAAENLLENAKAESSESDEDESDNDLLGNDVPSEVKPAITEIESVVPATRVLKKKKLKINVHRPVGTRVVFDEEGNTLPPLATLADRTNESSAIDVDKVQERYQKMREVLKQEDKVDKVHARQLRKEKRLKQKMKLKRDRAEDEEEEGSESEEEATVGRPNKKSKLYFDSDSDMDTEEKKMVDINTNKISLAEQEDLALKLLGSMNS
ncbi:DEAD-box ATP-dependent RNA helicase 32-like [Chenopodium quinoa]|uniref:DEAD-box ATP-dependent RNA helicase 32-like n=1 Tax=Chenopodium quinoa TaxID=63459 RepID=UPI000B76CC04|nr:DEAD-box ATP-dependent RNA helicase 32-like [Chenopodium quinoa]